MVTERALELPSRIRSLLGERLGSRRADMWFDSASTVSVEGGKLAVEAESSYAADWIRKNFGGDLRAVSQEALGRDDFELRVKETPATNIIDAPARSTATSDPSDNPPLRAPLHTRHRTTEAWRRLEDFVVGPSNKMAFESALNFATTHSIGNCLVIYGSCGVGKTHLLQGLCRRRRESRTQQRVRYVTAEQFTNEYIQSVRNGTIDAFRARVRRVDVLAIDDVHFLAGKTATQNEFLHTLDAVQLAGSQVVLATDEHPHLVVSCLYLDFDIYRPTKVALDLFLPRVPKGGIVAFDELNEEAFPGETIAVLEKMNLNTMRVRRFDFEPRISYMVMGE